MLNSFEIIKSAWPACTLWVDCFAHLDLRIKASVIAVSLHCLRYQQYVCGYEAECAYGCQYGVSVSAHHLSGR